MTCFVPPGATSRILGSWGSILNTCCRMQTFYCRGIRPLLIVKQCLHSIMDNPLSLSRSQSFNNFFPHFLPLLMLPRIFFMGAVRNSLDTSSLSLLLSSRLNFQIKTCWSVKYEPTKWRSPDLVLLRWFLIRVSILKEKTKKERKKENSQIKITETRQIVYWLFPLLKTKFCFHYNAERLNITTSNILPPLQS